MNSKSAVGASTRFIIVGAVLYASWYFLYEFFLKPHTSFDEVLIHALVVPAEALFGLFHVAIQDFSSLDGAYRSHIGLADSLGVTVGAPCDGAPLIGLYVSFIVAFPGPWRTKCWFVPAGVCLIHLMNILRIMGLAIIVSWNPDWLAFNHDYTFTIAIYGYVFYLWYLWIYRFANKTATVK
jgi:exosortase family protein XrtF